jgi:hypothetical protein
VGSPLRPSNPIALEMSRRARGDVPIGPNRTKPDQTGPGRTDPRAALLVSSRRDRLNMSP